MDYLVRVLPRAEQDLEGIYLAIRADLSEPATEWFRDMVEALRSLSATATPPAPAQAHPRTTRKLQKPTRTPTTSYPSPTSRAPQPSPVLFLLYLPGQTWYPIGMLKAIAGSLIDRTERILNPPTAAWLRYNLGNRSYFYPFGTAMNGQTSRLEATRQIIFNCGIRAIVETGTYRGTTTEWFAGFHLPVISVEAERRSFLFARHRLAPFPNVRLEFGNSVDVLSALREHLDLSQPTLFYLDAHWKSHLPLREEVSLILGSFARPIISIDDFRVPGQSGYGYDDYGEGKALTAEYLEGALPEGVSVLYPSTPAEQETGRRRGWAVLSSHPDLTASLTRMHLLRHA